MSANVDPAEAEAIRELMTGAAEPEVQEHDFSKPRRFSAADLREVRDGLGGALAAIEERLAETLGLTCSLEVAAVDEVSAEHALQAWANPLVALRFAVGAQPAWLMWTSGAATHVVERSLGSSDEPDEARRLTSLESALVETLLSTVAEGLALALSLEPTDAALVQSERMLGSWREGGESASPYRLAIEIGVQGPGGPSTMTAYLPIDRADAALARLDASGVELTPSLASIEVDVRARLGSCQVPLRQLLELEVGDVVPLEVAVGDPADVTVDDHVFARGPLGTSAGRLAVRIEEFDRERPPQPEEPR